MFNGYFMQALLGYDENQKLTLYVNPYSPLNPVGKRFEKGTPLPTSVYDFCEDGSAPMDALHALQHYFDKVEGPKIQSRSGHAKPQIRGKSGSKIRPKR